MLNSLNCKSKLTSKKKEIKKFQNPIQAKGMQWDAPEMGSGL